MKHKQNPKKQPKKTKTAKKQKNWKSQKGADRTRGSLEKRGNDKQVPLFVLDNVNTKMPHTSLLLWSGDVLQGQ